MSYILDALKKADAQRERDPGRGIHAQAAPVQHPPTAGSARKGLAVAVLVLLALGAAAGWLWTRGALPGTVQSPAEVPRAAAVPAPGPTPAPALLPIPALAPAPAPAPQPAAANQVLPLAPPPLAAAAPVPVPAPPASAPTLAPTSAPAPALAIVAMKDLSAELQRELPRMSVTGGVYSANAAQRMLIVNGQVFNEGSEVAPGVVLEAVRDKSAVLRFRDTRFAVAY